MDNTNLRLIVNIGIVNYTGRYIHEKHHFFLYDTHTFQNENSYQYQDLMIDKQEFTKFSLPRYTHTCTFL